MLKKEEMEHIKKVLDEDTKRMMTQAQGLLSPKDGGIPQSGTVARTGLFIEMHKNCQCAHSVNEMLITLQAKEEEANKEGDGIAPAPKMKPPKEKSEE